jgi:hypothetical protein
MKDFLTALAGAAVVAGVASTALAQTTQVPAPTNPNTKVYAYKKTAPPKPAATAPQAGAASSSEYLIGAAPYGSPRWWEMMGRTEGGQGSD